MVVCDGFPVCVTGTIHIIFHSDWVDCRGAIVMLCNGMNVAEKTRCNGHLTSQ